MSHTPFYDPGDPFNAVSLRDHAHVIIVPDGTVCITRPERRRRTAYRRLSPVTRAMLDALVNGRFWTTRLHDSWGMVTVYSGATFTYPHHDVPV